MACADLSKGRDGGFHQLVVDNPPNAVESEFPLIVLTYFMNLSKSELENGNVGLSN